MLRILGESKFLQCQKSLVGLRRTQHTLQPRGLGARFSPDDRCRVLKHQSHWPRPGRNRRWRSPAQIQFRREISRPKHGNDTIYPRDPLRRARVEQWMDWANYETSISLRGAFLGGMLNEPPWNNPWFIEQGRRQITKEVGQLDQHLSAVGPYITGHDFTVADIPIGLVVNRWFCLNLDRPDYPSVARYYQNLSARPAYMRHVRNGLP